MSELKSLSAADQAAWDAQLQSPPPPPPAAPPPPPPAAPPAPAPETNAADDVDGSLQAQDGKKYVPVATFVEQRKALKGQVDDLKAMLDQANAQIGVLLKASAQTPASPPPPPPPPATNPHDKELEPLEHARWELNKANERLAALEGKSAQQDQLTLQQQTLQKQHQAYVKAHDAFVAKNPEYAEAYEFAVQQLVDYNINVLGKDQTTAVAMASAAEWQIVTQAVSENKNPMERLWQMAKWRGFTPKAKTAAAAPPGETEAQKAARLAAAGAAAISLSSVPGSTANIGPTAEALAGMSKEKFAAALADDADGEKWRKIAGG